MGLYNQQELDSMSQEAKCFLIFEDNLSTKEKVTELSGRGVGMSAIKAEIDALGAEINIKNVETKGVAFSFIFDLEIGVI
jgi:two-component system chemotaxis sensor kinase CheA